MAPSCAVCETQPIRSHALA